MNSRQTGGWRVPPRDPPDPTVIVRPLTPDERQRYGLDDPEEDPAMPRPPLPAATITTIRARLAQGETQYAIAKALHVSRSLVQRIAHADPSSKAREAHPSPSLESKEDPMPKLTEDQKASIRARLAAGESSQAIGASMDVSPFIIQRYAPKREAVQAQRAATAPAAIPYAQSERGLLTPQAVSTEAPSVVEAALQDLAVQVGDQAQTALRHVVASQAALEAAQEALRDIEAQGAAIQLVRELLGLAPEESAEEPDVEAAREEGKGMRS